MSKKNDIKIYAVDSKELGNFESKDKVVIIHGAWFTIESMLDYAGQFKDKHVICLSLPNRDKFTDKSEEVNVDLYADLLFRKLSDIIDISDSSLNISLHGWSLGGTTSLVMASKHPNTFKAIICLFSSPDWLDLKLPMPKNNFIKNCTVPLLILTMKSKDFKFKDALGLVKKYLKNTSDYTACLLDGKVVAEFKPSGRFKNLNIPVYVIKGEIDSLVQKDNIELFNREVGGVTGIELKGKGHMAIIEDGKYVASVAKKLLGWTTK